MSFKTMRIEEIFNKEFLDRSPWGNRDIQKKDKE